MQIIFRLERLDIGNITNNSKEVVRATFGKKDGELFEVLDILLDVEEAKMYMIGHEYIITM